LWLPREDVLTFEEISRLADLFGELGVDRLRVTGGEPLLRRNLPDLIRQLSSKSWVKDLALTTNGVLLAERAAELRAAGLHRLTVSLDTLQRDRFIRLARLDALPAVLAGIEAARRVGFTGLKLDTVVTRGDNDDDFIDLLVFGR
jgi:cyclic pyranopterin phosphate synthase